MSKLNQQRFGKNFFHGQIILIYKKLREKIFYFEQVLHSEKCFLWKRCGLKRNSKFKIENLSLLLKENCSITAVEIISSGRRQNQIFFFKRKVGLLFYEGIYNFIVFLT